MRKYLCFFVLLVASVFCQSSLTPYKYVDGKMYELVWNDEFNYDNYLDPNKWTFDIGGHGWGNNELQYYTNGRNVYVRNGYLKIVAKRERYQTNEGVWNYTSSRLLTRGLVNFKYGYFEIAAKVPYGSGSWPAIWMLPTYNKYGSWPYSGEIDIVEHMGQYQGVIFGSVHTEDYNHKIKTEKTGRIQIRDPHLYFYRYGVKWTPEKIEWFVNDVKYFEFNNENKGPKTWPFDEPFHLLLNIAIGGWGGRVDNSMFPMVMDIDYVRVYQGYQ